MQPYIAEPISRMELRRYANKIRKNLGFEDKLYFPIMEFLEMLPEVFSHDNFYFEVVEDNQLPREVHADIDIENNHMRIKNSVYEGAYNGVGRDRFTIAHEIGHYFLLTYGGIKLQRNTGNLDIKTYQDPEWQANCFAGELLVPSKLIKGMNPQQVMDLCGVSFQAACMQLKKNK